MEPIGTNKASKNLLEHLFLTVWLILYKTLQHLMNIHTVDNVFNVCSYFSHCSWAPEFT